MRSTIYASALALLASPSLAQFPAIPTDLTVLSSRLDPQVNISYKQADICERTAGVKSYSGYVHLPENLISDVGHYDVHTYFVYFEARHNASTAPLAIYLAGGPGESSIYAALSSESGPCYVNINGTDTVVNPWSFNEYANVLYIDQPAQTGFSYNELINGTFDLLDNSVTPVHFASGVPAANASFGYGTFSSQESRKTVNNTVQAAKLLRHFVEHWLSSFPGYVTQSNKVSLWGNSYGGYWVPETAVQFSKYFDDLSLDHPLACKNLTVDAIGITNGCVDIESAMTGYPDFAYNNTYGIQFGSEDIYEQALYNITKRGGCQDLIELCRISGQTGDPDFTGNNATVNEICMGAFYYCELNVIASFPDLSMRDAFDIAISQPNPPCPYYLPVSQYLNMASTQKALGVPLNFTQDSNVVTGNFGLLAPNPEMPLSASTGDPVRQNGLPNIEYLLAKSVKIAFIFGDRDYRCPWTGGEATALATKWTHQTDFSNAGYEELQGIQTPIDQGGLNAVVKQHGRFSFSRILDAGHTVSAYAPETVYKIFERTLKGLDIVTGTKVADDLYQTTGPRSSLEWRNKLPENVPGTCIVAGRFCETNPWTVVIGSDS